LREPSVRFRPLAPWIANEKRDLPSQTVAFRKIDGGEAGAKGTKIEPVQ